MIVRVTRAYNRLILEKKIVRTKVNELIYPLYKTINSLIKTEYKCWPDKWVMFPEDFWLRILDLIKSSSDPTTDDVWDIVYI